MITMEQLEHLEGRIIKALELISDLRLENNHLESEMERIKSANDQLKLTAEEKTASAASMKNQLEATRTELERLQGKEAGLEEKLHEIITRLDGVKSSGNAPALDEITAKNDMSSVASISNPAIENLTENMPDHLEDAPDFLHEEIMPETTPIDDMVDGEDEIVLLEDEEDDEVIIMDDEPEEEHHEELMPESHDLEGTISLNPEHEDESLIINENDDEDVLGVFQNEEDDELLIVEDEEGHKKK